MPDWRQYVGIYAALFVGGIASMHTHFIEYIIILLVALGYTGFVAYDEQKQLNKYLEKHYEKEDRMRLDRNKIAREVVKDIEHDYYRCRSTDDFEGIEIALDKWQSFKAKFEE